MIVEGFEVEGIIKVDNARVYGLGESIIASGYPMQIGTKLMADNSPVEKIVIGETDMKRAKHLGKAIPGSGHDCYLKGITLQFDLQVPEYIWRQLDRYHFIDYVSSQSKMHRILKMDIDKACNKYVDWEVIDNLEEIIYYYNNFEEELEGFKKNNPKGEFGFTLRNGEMVKGTKEELFNIIVANIPSGLMLTARMTTNYLQLKSIINQREHHKMQEWRYLTDWFKGLPMVSDIILK